MKSFPLPLHLLLPSAALATKLLLPLYVYPSKEGLWSPVYTAIATHPKVEFQIILNPSNGPGGSTPGYNNDWIAGVARLNAFPNVHTSGYVYTSYNARPATDISADTANWAGWNGYGDANISVNGIFFDEVPNWTGLKGLEDVSYMSAITHTAKAQFLEDGHFEVIYNPGAKPVHDEYFELADYTVVFEDYAAEFDAMVLKENVPSGKESKASLLLHDFVGSNLPDENVQQWLESFAKAGVGSVNILDYGYHQANSEDGPADLGSVAGFLSNC